MSSKEEIWAHRLQREILALTEEGEDKNDIAVLPPFIKVQSHKLDIKEGFCNVNFAITVEGVERAPSGPVAADKDLKEKVDSALGGKDSEHDDGETTAETEEADAAKIPPEAPEPTKFKVQVVITLDASLQRNLTVFSASSSYPFFKPRATLTSGAEHFTATKIKNGDEIQIDCDWTPSLHLNDAALNIALKVRESIKRGEPCLKVVTKRSIEDDLMKEVRADISKAGAKMSSFFSDLKNKASAVAEELDQAVASGSSGRKQEGDGAASPAPKRKILLPTKKTEKAPKPPAKIVTVDNIAMGDEIDLSCDPWNKAVGMYPCKALRRPEFVAVAMEASGQNKRGKVTKAGLSGAGSMFRSFTKSAKSLVEEYFLMLTKDLIIEIRCNKFSVATATVSFAIPVSHLAKLKFRREESISLFFKQAPEDPIIYMCESSAEAVKQIQSILKRHGVKGKHTNATMQKSVQSAIQMVEDIKVMEKKLQESPSAEQVTIIMDLYRQAAERFEVAGDARHEEVVSHMRDFLAAPLTASILDGSFEKKQQASSTQKQEPVVEEKEIAATNSVAKTEPKNEAKAGSDAAATGGDDAAIEKAMEAAESMLQDAHDDLKDLGIVDEDDHDIQLPASPSAAKTGDDVVAEFEDMLKDADKELQELMGS